MYCVESIKENISVLSRQTSKSCTTVDESINNFLDMILKVQKELGGIGEKLESLLRMLKDSFMDMPQEDFNAIHPTFRKAVTALTLLYVKCRKSDLYSGIKTQLAKLKSYIDDLNEWENDYKIFRMELPASDEFNTLVSQIK